MNFPVRRKCHFMPKFCLVRWLRLSKYQRTRDILVTGFALHFLILAVYLWLFQLDYIVMEIECGGVWGKGKLWWVVERNKVNTECNCIRIIRTGRWGNHLYQFMHALQIATLARIDRIYVPYKNWFLLKEGFTTKNGIHVIRGDPPKDMKCVANKFFVYLLEVPPMNVSIINLFRDTYMKMFPDPKLPPNSLVIHIRSGDVFYQTKKLAEKYYCQPPCKFYETAMKARNWSHIEVLAEDFLNPCVQYVIDRGAHHQFRDVIGDMAYILHAENLVQSKGTFDYGTALMATGKKTLYMYNTLDKWLGTHYNCVPTQIYRDKMIDKWYIMDWQKKIMVESADCSNWTVIERKNPEDWLFKNK